MKLNLFLSGACLAVALITAPAAHADVNALKLFNTGSGFTAGQTDTHWNIIDAPTVNGQSYNASAGTPWAPKVTDLSGFPGQYWTPSDADSKWISPFAKYDGTTSLNGSTVQDGMSDLSGFYTWRTTLDTTGVNLSTMLPVEGLWWNDNQGYKIFLNGTEIATGSPLQDGYGSLATPADFNILGSQLTNGINTLDFVSYNTPQYGGNPTAIRVAFSSAPIPEPAFFQLGALLFGGGGLVALRLRKRTR